MQMKKGKHFSEPFRVSNGIRQRGVVSQYLLAVYFGVLGTRLFGLADSVR